MRTSYRVTTKHTTGYMDGQHVLTVNQNPNGSLYITGTGFGCSRDYQTRNHKEALKTFLAENGMKMMICNKIYR